MSANGIEIGNVDVSEIDVGLIAKFFEDLPEKALHLGIRVVLAVVVFLIGAEIIKLIRRLLKKSLNRTNVDTGAVQFIDSFVKAALYVVLVFMIATSFGVDATSVLAVLGSAGVAIGLAVQGSLSNFAGGVLILLVKPFKVGDYIIEDSKKNEGTVTEIQIFYTKLTTPDEKIIILPNGTLANTSLTNFTATEKRRLDIKVGISYTADLQAAKQVLYTLMETDELVMPQFERTVFVEELSSSAVILGMRCYIRNEDYWPTRYKLLELIKEEFDKKDICIPFQQMDVHLLQ